jgi:Ca-activated chloride channel homolog
MRRLFLLCGLMLLITRHCATQQTPTYNMTVKVDEITLTFHASDLHGQPVTNLRLEDLRLLDNGQPPNKILSFQLSEDRPIRAGILLDTSESMTAESASSRDLAIRYAQHMLRQTRDEAFVMKFAFQSDIAQPWTSNPTALVSGINRFVSVRSRAGTAVISAIYRACLNQFGHTSPPDAANLILLFSDGEDNAGLGSLKEAVDACQRSNTAIYAVLPRTESVGVKTLADLSTQTGGRILYPSDAEATIVEDLKAVISERRTQYQLVYRPASLKHDGSFHRIELTSLHGEASLTTRSGYYALWR